MVRIKGENLFPTIGLEISPRTMTWRKGIQNARHPINAMLNYGYGVLKGEIQGEIIGAGAKSRYWRHAQWFR